MKVFRIFAAQLYLRTRVNLRASAINGTNCFNHLTLNNAIILVATSLFYSLLSTAMCSHLTRPPQSLAVLQMILFLVTKHDTVDELSRGSIFTININIDKPTKSNQSSSKPSPQKLVDPAVKHNLVDQQSKSQRKEKKKNTSITVLPSSGPEPIQISSFYPSNPSSSMNERKQ